jgi:hypothetical protein
MTGVEFQAGVGRYISVATRMKLALGPTQVQVHRRFTRG